MSKSTIISLSILGALAITASIYFGYMYLNELKSSNGNNQNDIVNTNDNIDDKDNNASILDSEIDNVVNSIESDKSEIDFEDFDPQLEFGL